MQVTCPVCCARWAIESGLNDATARRAVLAAARLPVNLGELIIRYCALFRRADCGLDWGTALRIIERMSAAIADADVAATPEMWREALEQMLGRRDMLDLPLTGDAYVLSIVRAKARAGAEITKHADAQARTTHDSEAEADARGMQRLNALLAREGLSHP
jgi:hypothetical protein